MKRILAVCAFALSVVGSMAGEGTWCGFYGGAHVGMARESDPDWTYVGFGTVSDIDEVKDDMFGGLQLGYNWQRGNLVLGVEGDFSFTDIHGSGICPSPVWDCEIELRETASLRARFGYAICNWLPYVTVGYAHTEAEVYTHNSLAGKFSDEGDLYGMVYGAGVAYAITENLSVFVEGLYYDFKEETLRVDASLPVEIGVKPTIYRAGFNWRFW